MTLATAAWFSLVTYMLTIDPIRTAFTRVQCYFEKVCGVILGVLGIKIFMEK